MGGLKFSNLGSNEQEQLKSWNNIRLSPTTVSKRKQLRSIMDDFTSFTWRGVDAFDMFGAFIINKNSLRFYNGPSFSNEYTKPQFESAAGQLVGVTFQIQKIAFTIGVYWISEEDYRKMIDWLNPYEINTLTFGFEPNYYYLVKVASIGDATRYPVGYDEGRHMYYTEIPLTFEIQGYPCAYRNIGYEFNGALDSSSTESKWIYNYILKDVDDNKFQSDLAMPFKYKMHLNLQPKTGTTASAIGRLSIECDAFYENALDRHLFNIDFVNLTYNGDLDGYYLDLVYDSATGLLYWDRGGSKLFLLSRLSTGCTGSRIVDSLYGTSYKVLGTFDEWSFDLSKWKLKITITTNTDLKLENPNISTATNYYIEMRARTNAM